MRKIRAYCLVIGTSLSLTSSCAQHAERVSTLSADTPTDSTQVFPNPFSYDSGMTFPLDTAAFVNVVLFDVSGDPVDTLCNRVYEAGHHAVTWEGRDAFGNLAKSGVYFYHLRRVNVGTQDTVTVVKKFNYYR